MNSHRFVVLALTACFLAVCIGCVGTVNLTYNPGVCPSATLPCPVALSLSKEFTNYEILPGGSAQVVKWRTPMGPALRKYAIYVAQSVFGDVQLLDGQPPRDDVKLLLVPRIGSSDFQITDSLKLDPFGSDRTVIGAMSVQWDFNDPKTGQTLLSTRVRCESTHGLGGGFHRPTGVPYVANSLMTNLTSATIQRFNASKDIQRLSGH